MIILCMMGIGMMVASMMILVVKQGLLGMLVMQDVMAFIVPAIAAMAIFYHKPLTAMHLDRAPGWKALFVVILFYVASLPAMNWLVSVNETMHLPSWMSGIEHWMRSAEDAAAQTTRQILDIHSVGMLVATTFVVGFMAGLSEEILFRGAILRTMQDSRLGTHATVWIVAIVFSAFHLQFYGFFPRMILGLWLGYLMVWTGSLWVPIIAHTLNNSTVVVLSFLTNRGVVPDGTADSIGIPADNALPWLAMVSIVISIVIAVWASKYLARDNGQDKKINNSLPRPD